MQIVKAIDSIGMFCPNKRFFAATLRRRGILLPVPGAMGNKKMVFGEWFWCIVFGV